MQYYIEVLKKGTEYYWRIMSGNGKILAHSETYATRFGAMKTAKKLAGIMHCEIKQLSGVK